MVFVVPLDGLTFYKNKHLLADVFVAGRLLFRRFWCITTSTMLPTWLALSYRLHFRHGIQSVFRHLFRTGRHLCRCLLYHRHHFLPFQAFRLSFYLPSFALPSFLFIPTYLPYLPVFVACLPLKHYSIYTFIHIKFHSIPHRQPSLVSHIYGLFQDLAGTAGWAWKTVRGKMPTTLYCLSHSHAPTPTQPSLEQTVLLVTPQACICFCLCLCTMPASLEENDS